MTLPLIFLKVIFMLADSTIKELSLRLITEEKEALTTAGRQGHYWRPASSFPDQVQCCLHWRAASPHVR